MTGVTIEAGLLEGALDTRGVQYSHLYAGGVCCDRTQICN